MEGAGARTACRDRGLERDSKLPNPSMDTTPMHGTGKQFNQAQPRYRRRFGYS
jgi:hypothetical protein